MTPPAPDILITRRSRERAVLVGVATGIGGRQHVDEHLDELSLLAESAGAKVIHRMVQERHRIDPATFIGKGKAEELAWLVREKDVQLVIFDDDLSSVQVRNLEKLITCKLVDRSALILDIFASRARTREARTQVELAQLQYFLPRLTRQWTHLSKQYGGIGTKGPGETQIETDRRAIRTRIGHLRGQLTRIAREREVQRKGRRDFPRVALVGYTNAGKSTLLNWFTDAGVLVEDRLFATLDSTVRLVRLSPAHRILLCDTVGFIRKLPHHLVASFKSTLEEVREADLLLHVADVSHPNLDEHIGVVNETLEEITASGKPTIMVFNKIDRLGDRTLLGTLKKSHERAVFISATRSINMSALVAEIESALAHLITEDTVTLGADDYPLISRLHEIAEVLETTYEADRVTVRFRIGRAHAGRLRKILARRTPSDRGR